MDVSIGDDSVVALSSLIDKYPYIFPILAFVLICYMIKETIIKCKEIDLEIEKEITKRSK